MNENGHYGRRMPGRAPPCEECGKRAGIRRWAWGGKWYCRGCASQNGRLGRAHDFEQDFEQKWGAVPTTIPVDPHADEIRGLHEVSMQLSARALVALEDAAKSLREGETASVLRSIEAALVTLRERDIAQNSIRMLRALSQPPPELPTHECEDHQAAEAASAGTSLSEL